MTRKDQLTYCTICRKRKFNTQKGVVCSLTDEWADFDPECESFEEDTIAIENKKDREALQKISDLEDQTLGLSKYGIKNQVVAGIILVTLALVWLIIPWVKMGVFFYYAPVLLIFGVIILIRGIIKERKRFNAKKKPQQEADILDTPKTQSFDTD